MANPPPAKHSDCSASALATGDPTASPVVPGLATLADAMAGAQAAIEKRGPMPELAAAVGLTVVADLPIDQIVSDGISLGTLSGTRSIEAVKGWQAMEDRPRVVVLAGAVGRGKTAAAAWAICHVAAAGFSARYVDAEEVEQLYSGWDGGADRRSILHAKFLVIDDIGTERKATTMERALIKILSYRQRVDTLLISNLTKKEFQKRYTDKRLESRMKLASWVAGVGDDLRGSK